MNYQLSYQISFSTFSFRFLSHLWFADLLHWYIWPKLTASGSRQLVFNILVYVPESEVNFIGFQWYHLLQKNVTQFLVMKLRQKWNGDGEFRIWTRTGIRTGKHVRKSLDTCARRWSENCPPEDCPPTNSSLC